MRRIWFACALASLAGCDQLLVLNEVKTYDVQYLGHFINDPTGDWDGDGDPNATDLCPTLAHDELGATTDADGDGVGDGCDPNPMTPGDCLVLFDDFPLPTPSPMWQADGGPIEVAQDGFYPFYHYLQFASTREEIVSLAGKLDLEAVTLRGYVQAGDPGGTTGRYALEAFVAMTRSPSMLAANGTACAIESNGTGSVVEAVTTVDGHDTTAAQVPIGNELVGSSNSFRLSWSWSPYPVNATCSGSLSGGGRTDGASTVVAMPPSEVFALRGVHVGLHVYVVEGWGRSCPAQ